MVKTSTKDRLPIRHDTRRVNGLVLESTNETIFAKGTPFRRRKWGRALDFKLSQKPQNRVKF